MSVRRKALASRSRIIALRSTVWEVIQLTAARVEVEAWEKAHEARCCSEVVALRAEAMREAET